MIANVLPRIPHARLSSLSDDRLLSPERQRVLADELLPQCDSWNILASEIVYRGWMTPYQMARVGERKTEELFLGSYVIEDLIGEGGMGKIYRARNWKLNTYAAVKVVRKERSTDPLVVSRFLREIEALGAIRHPNIVHAYDADFSNDQLYYAMEYVPGIDLGQYLQQNGAMPFGQACQYVIQLADALHYISMIGLVHRDIKPGNILLTTDQRVKLLDLGLARFEGENCQSGEITRVGMMIGTPDYVAPEQICDSHGADIRSDIYSLGCTLYHMVTGRAPFEGRNSVEKLHCHLTQEAISPKTLNPEVPVELVKVIRMMMAKKPRDRFQDPSELILALKPFVFRSGDTVDAASAPTHPGFPTVTPMTTLPRTDEIPLEQIPMIMESKQSNSQGLWLRLCYWLQRLHWLFAVLLAGLALGLFLAKM